MSDQIYNIKDITESSEVYESKPKAVYSLLLYVFLAIIVAAFVWMYFFKIDVVVKAVGTIGTTNERVTLTNRVSGVVKECYINDGDSVKKGSILYKIDTKDMEVKLKGAQKELSDLNDRLQMSKKYLLWLGDNTVNMKELHLNKYYQEYDSRKKKIELAIKSNRLDKNELSDSYNLQSSTNAETIEYYNGEVNKTKALIECVNTRSNTFSTEEDFYYSKAEAYITQCNSIETQYNDKIEGAKQELDEIQKQLEDDQKRNQQLQSQEGGEIGQDQQSDENPDQEKGDVMTEGESGLSENLKELEDNIQQYENDKINDITKLQNETIADLETNIKSYEDKILTLKQEQKGIEQKRSNILPDQSMESDKIIADEKQTVLSEESELESQKGELETDIKSAKDSINNATVKAAIPGTVNLMEPIVVGNYINSQTAVLTILPKGSIDTLPYDVTAYIDNKDIAKIKKGMKVTYEIAAYPSDEYGDIIGKVKFISPDLKVHENGMNGDYMIKTSITEIKKSKKHKSLKLKSGMLCDVKIVTEQKRLLFYFLEKIKLEN